MRGAEELGFAAQSPQSAAIPGGGLKYSLTLIFIPSAGGEPKTSLTVDVLQIAINKFQPLIRINREPSYAAMALTLHYVSVINDKRLRLQPFIVYSKNSSGWFDGAAGSASVPRAQL